MNAWSVILLGAAAVAGAILWFVIDRRRRDITARATVLAAAVPLALLGVAGLLALIGDRPGDPLLATGTTLATLAAVTGGGLVATAVLRLADDVPIRLHTGTEAVMPTGTVSDPQTLRGGAWIGALERIAIVVTLLTGWPEGLAVILAVKGLGRYPELRRPAAAERFIVGTLASALWAVAAVGVVMALRG